MLVLFNVQIRDDDFTQLISNNPNLEAIYLEYCVKITERKAMECFNRLSKLRNLSIKECPKISGAFFPTMTNLECFILDHNHQQYERGNSIFSSFYQMRNLQYLNLYGSAHFNNELLKSLVRCPNLKSLNIGYTSINNGCAKTF